MAEIKNTFLKQRMNQDIDSRLLPNGEYREAINLQISRSEGSTVGEFENVLGNTSISSLNGDNAVIIGQYVNETTNKVYLFATNYNEVNGVRSVGADHFIYELSLEGSFNKILLVTGNFLNFNQSFPMLGINLVEDLLFFTDNLNQPRKINISLANPSSLSTPSHYENEDQISVAKYAPCDPIVVFDRVNIRLTSLVNASKTINVDTVAGLKIGDFVSPFETIVPTAFPSPLSQWDKANYIVAINSNVLTLSEPMTAPDAFKLICQRPTMTNKTEEFLSNGLSTPLTVTAGPVYTVTLPATNFTPDIMPRVGDIIVDPTNPSTIPVNTTILTTIASFATATSTKWTLTFSNAITTTTGTTIKIGINANYDPNGWQGDAAFLEDKFVRFSYRFKFEDNEYSLMAPFSQPMFIPKQYSEFGGGENSDTIDMDNAYKSTIVNWFENNIENIVLKTPMPFNAPLKMLTEILATEVDLLYKESDALSVKVLDTIRFSDLADTAFSSILFSDPINGSAITEYFYPYDYASSKPYKTLPQGQTTRVYDKVPIKALAQELISNRVVYGNYVDKHSSPSSIDFTALVTKKKPYKNNFVPYPYHNLKQNRTYQVGFVLSDRYGRQSDVILSSYDNIEGVGGSTVYSPYNSYNDQLTYPVIDWLGDALSVRVDTAVGEQTTSGQPGVWDATTNPLGWYSYKVVVKQQQQEYYNVYLPGFVNGLPIVGDEEENKSSFSVLLSDNINKVPRNLQEVGPTDTEYSSSELLYIRVNNPNINNKTTRPYGYPRKSTPWNKQYFPGFVKQEVLSISTIKDMEISAIPFVANAPEGDYGQVGTTETAGVTVPNSIGSIPWGQSPITQPFYNSDLNPFALKIDTTPNGKVAINNTEVPTVPGGIGADTNSNIAGSIDVNTMVPFLSVAETKPVYSLLEIFWETSLQGKLNTLNALINAQYAGISSTSSSAASFAESSASTTKIGASIAFITGGGTTVTNNAHLTVSLLSAFRASDVNESTDVKALFDIAYEGTQALYDLDTNSLFFYGTSSANNPSTDVYNINIQTVYDDGSGADGFPFTDTHSYVATLSNVAPSFTNCANPTDITQVSTTIKQFTAVNGSANTNVQGNQLIFDLDPTQANYSTINSQFNMSSSGLLTVNSGVLIDNTSYTVVGRVTDVEGNGLSATCSITFTVGIQRVPQSICTGRIGTDTTACGESFQYAFLASATSDSTTLLAWPLTVNTANGVSVTFPQPTKNYNVRNVYNANNNPNATTGALTQGVMSITPTLTSTLTPGGGSVTVYYAIQYRSSSNSTWTQAVDASNNIVPAKQLSASFNNPDSDTLDFSIAGEYRVFSNDISGEGCSAASGAATFFVQFADDTYPGEACTGPL